jgi:hypothetical protein
MPNQIGSPPDSLVQYGVTNHPVFGEPLESNSCVDTWTFTAAPPPDEVIHSGVYSAVVVEPTPGERVDVVQSLGGCIIGVARIIDTFGHLFPTHVEPRGISDVVQTVERPQ